MNKQVKEYIDTAVYRARLEFQKDVQSATRDLLRQLRGEGGYLVTKAGSGRWPSTWKQDISASKFAITDGRLDLFDAQDVLVASFAPGEWAEVEKAGV